MLTLLLSAQCPFPINRLALSALVSSDNSFLSIRREPNLEALEGTPPSYRRNMYTVCMLSCFNRVRLFATLWTVTHQTPLSMGFSRQEYWSGLPCSPPEDLPRDQTHISYVSCNDRWVLYLVQPGKPKHIHYHM